VLFIWRQDDVIDWWLLRDYDPPAEIVELAENTTMTDLGERYFYVYQPQLLDRETFRQQCIVAEKSIVLGCYVSRQGIYIYDVTDEQLAGIREVTAAHEMLHVAYERLNTAERERIDELNLAIYDQLDNERIKRTIQAYRDRDPNIVANELHSVLPTEVRELDNPELEEYYAQYFDDRLAVVEYSEQYASVFDEARQRVEQLDEQLKQQRDEIDTLQTTLDNQASSLEAERSRLNQLFEDEQFEEYNEGVSTFNANVQSYNETVNRLRSLIDRYNRLVAERNDAVVAFESLTTSIDTRPPDTIDPLQ
jgi:uncharacterized protein YukE